MSIRRSDVVACLLAIGLPLIPWTSWAQDDPQAAIAPSVQYNVTIGQHKALSAKMTDAEADNVLSKLSAMLVAESPTCDVRLTRSGSISVFDSKLFPFSVNSEEDFEKFKQTPPSLKVIAEINWCNSLGPGILGCSSQPGRAWVVVRYPKAEHLLWAHEFAHTAGLPHRDDLHALMRPSLYSDDTVVSADECQKIRMGSAAVNSAMAAAAEGPPSSPNGATAPPVPNGPPQPVTAFVEQGWPEGVPFNVARTYSDADVEVLSAILHDKSKADLWRNTVSTLGAIGTEKAKYILMEFLLHDPDETLTTSEYLGKANVPVALGWLVGRSLESHKPDLATIAILINMTQSEWWTDTAKIDWKTQIYESRSDLISALVVKASVGCALSQAEECRIRLAQLGASASTGAAPHTSQADAALVTNSLGQAALYNIERVSPETRNAINASGGANLVSSLLRERGRVAEQGGLTAYYANPSVSPIH